MTTLKFFARLVENCGTSIAHLAPFGEALTAIDARSQHRTAEDLCRRRRSTLARSRKSMGAGSGGCATLPRSEPREALL
jgi:hypothetical protein